VDQKFLAVLFPEKEPLLPLCDGVRHQLNVRQYNFLLRGKPFSSIDNHSYLDFIPDKKGCQVTI